MLHPIMEPKRPSAERRLVVPPASGAAALRLPSADELPPPYVDERLVRPETREEMVRGRRIQALPAKAEHADPHLVLDRVIGNCVAPGYTASTDLLTRATEASDFATDTCIRRSGIDPRTGSRYLEEVAFEICNTQSRANMIERAQDLTVCGVRRVFAIFVKKGELCEWSAAQDRFVTLDLDGTIEDRTFVRSLPIRALFDAAAADTAAVDALLVKGNPRLVELMTEVRSEARSEARIETACDFLGIPFGPRELERMAELDAEGLDALYDHLKAEHRWPND